MSDLEDYFDDEDLYFDDGAADDMAAVADDLAERTMHSPNWIDDPTLDTVDYWSDWEYYSDEFFDEAHGREKEALASSKEADPTRPGKRKAEDNQRPGKRQRLAPLDQFPPLGPDGGLSGLELEISKRPSIVWRSTSTSETPLLETKVVSKSVALLKDWANLPSPTWGVFKGEEFSEEDTNEVTSSLSLRDKKQTFAEPLQRTNHATQKVLDDSQAASENDEVATTSIAKTRGSKQPTSNKRKNQTSEDSKDDAESKESSKKRKATNTKKPEDTQKGRTIAAPKTTRSGKRRG